MDQYSNTNTLLPKNPIPSIISSEMKWWSLCEIFCRDECNFGDRCGAQCGAQCGDQCGYQCGDNCGGIGGGLGVSLRYILGIGVGFGVGATGHGGYQCEDRAESPSLGEFTSQLQH